MSPKKRRSKIRTALNTAVLVALLATSGWLTVEMRQRTDNGRLPALGSLQAEPTTPDDTAGAKAAAGRMTYLRLAHPARTVVRDTDGEVVATFTDGARTAVLTGPGRTFAEPRTTRATVVTDSWVRLLPRAWAKGAEQQKWFASWFHQYRGSTADDVFAIALQYGDGAKPAKNALGQRFRGDSQFGPVDVVNQRKEQSDFYDYLGTSWKFKDGLRETPEKNKYGALDCSGFVRMVYGYRSGYLLNATDTSTGAGLPRTANGIATGKPGLPILPLVKTGNTRNPLYYYARPSSIDALQPGDLVFFEMDKRTGIRLDHMAIYLGLDTDGHARFISSRKEANGPTLGDLGGDSRLDGDGFYAKWLRSAKRI
ncbi:NlpC/P60 family protein [Streptomyces sp. H39-C1]|uniref:NlpC/P60 family protein n=1 Tax=Streptomyces sp. H39-C1 TaxID=3004355 RepID=UPI0022B003FA|nr:NlpC/P60 family protein [Streptomyces sp. H39-C1]MCZ4095306.1 NlpC/P60 family protein [Streptomyces sp. H39-C1]